MTVKISQLASGTALQLTDWFEIARDIAGSPLSRRVSGQMIIDLVDAEANFEAAGAVSTLTSLLSSTDADEGAAMIGIEDDGGYFTGTDVEAALQEIGLALESAGGGGLPRPDFIAGNWVFADHAGATIAAGTSGALMVDVIHFTLFPVHKEITISDLGIRITTQIASGNLKLAIYANNPATGRPTGSPLAFTGNISTGSAANVSGDIDGANVTLQPGLYWAAIWIDSTADNGGSGVAVQRLNASAMSLGSTVIGGTQNQISTTSLQVGFGVVCAETFGTWPDVTAKSFSASSAAYAYQLKAA